MDNKLQLVEKLQAATNILVTVSNGPSVDQLAACIGLTLWLNKIGKHATAVFSGSIPNTLEFLQPEVTIEKNTDSLRDFIIALDKSKADKLRYKVEDRVVKIFITPYRTSLSADDLEFSQGDFNVDAIVALGVTKQEDLDQAIVSHGRILHDAVVTTVNTAEEGDLGSINWRDTAASSLSELVYDLCQQLDSHQLDAQIATALLTGIVAETDRFSNDKTSPNTMSVAAALMGAGANQQLVANKLEDGVASKTKGRTQKAAKVAPNDAPDGMLEISHDEELPPPVEPKPSSAPPPKVTPVATKPLSELPKVTPDETEPPLPEEPTQSEPAAGHLVIQPPTMGGTLTANSRPDDIQLEDEAVTDPLSAPVIDTDQQLLGREPSPPPSAPEPVAVPNTQPPPGPGVSNEPGAEDEQTLSEIEEAVDSPHLKRLKNQVNAALGTQSEDSPTPPPDQDKAATEFNPADFGLTTDEGPQAPPFAPPLWNPPPPGGQPPTP